MISHPATSRRGLSLAELAVVMVAMVLIIAPIIFALSQIVKAEGQMTGLAESARELEPLTLAFQNLVRESSTDTVAAPNNAGFVIRDGGETLDCYITPDPFNTTTYTLLGTIWYDAPNQLIRIQRVHPTVQPSWVAARNITACNFELGPSENPGAGYAGFAMDHGRSVLMEVTINNGRPYVHSVIAFSPNVR